MNDTARTLRLARILMYLALALACGLVLHRIADALVPVLLGLFLAYLANPLVESLVRRRVPRPLGILILVLSFAVALGAAVVLLPPLVGAELARFTEHDSGLEQRLAERLLPLLRDRLHLPASTTVDEALRQLVTRLGDLAQSATGEVAGAVGSALRTTAGLLSGLLTVLVTPIFAVFFLADFPRIGPALVELVPPRLRPDVVDVASEVDRALSSWLRGQLLVMLILGVLYATGFGLAHVPLGIGLGLLIGLMAFVPYLGVAIGLCLALTLSLAAPEPAGAAIGALLTVAAVQSLDATVITPRIVGGRVGLSPVAVIFALSLGGTLLGYLGLLLAVPGAAVTKVLIARARRAWLGSESYHRPAPAPAEAPAVPPEGA